MRILGPFVPGFLLLIFSTLGAGLIASDPALKDALARFTVWSGGGLAIVVTAMVVIEGGRDAGD